MISDNSDLFVYKPSTAAIDPRTCRMPRGTIFLSRDALPCPDGILSNSPFLNNPFLVGYLTDYLEFLELIILNDRLILGFSPRPVLQDRLFESPAVQWWIQEVGKVPEWREALLDPNRDSLPFFLAGPSYRFPGAHALCIEDSVKTKLCSLGILQENQVYTPDLTPVACIEKRLELDTPLREKFDELRRQYAEREPNDTMASSLALLHLDEALGDVLYLDEAFGASRCPYIVKQVLSGYPNVLTTARRTHMCLIHYLKDHLDAGARREADRLIELGSCTLFPKTPIAMQIIMNSSSPDDLLDTALQLRDEYSDFRSGVADIEGELCSEDITLGRKIKLVRYLEAMADGLWPTETRSIRRVTVELTGLLSLIRPLTLGSIKDAIESLAGMPTELIIGALRKRKVRVLHKTRKIFLRSRHCIQKIAWIFDLPPRTVEEAVLAGEAIRADFPTLISRVESGTWWKSGGNLRGTRYSSRPDISL
jgi:hypothetical protein